MRHYSIQEKLNLLEPKFPSLKRRNLGEFKNRKSCAYMQISCVEDLKKIVKICTLPGDALPIHMYSSGKNWGLGSHLPVQDGGILMDLSPMNRIIDLELKTGIAIIEPGVTQLQLSQALEGTPYMLNVTSSHTTTSIVGNALDRGVGFHRQRIEDLIGAEVLLSTGETLQLGGTWPLQPQAQKAFSYKHGLGPNLLPLLSQSNLGIVTKGVIALLPRPEKIQVFKITFSTAQFEAVIRIFAKFYQEEIIKSVMKVYNTSAIHMYSGEARSQENSFCGYFSLEGPTIMVDAKLQHVLSSLKPFPHMVLKEIHVSSQDVLSKMIYGNFHGNPMYNDAMINTSFKVQDGDIDTHSEEGWLSFLPIVPFDAHSLQRAFTMMHQCAQGTRVRPMATMNIISKSVVDLVIGLRFQRHPGAIAEAHQVLDALYKTFAQEGFYPYRLDVDHMDFLRQQVQNPAYIKMLQSIKHAFDPQGIIMPGRYDVSVESP